MESTKPILEAIALRRCLTATYNRASFKLAPHILYTRHGELHLDAVSLACDGRPPREEKLSTFRLTGLADLLVTDESFDPRPCYEPEAERYEGTTLFAIDIASDA